MIRYVAIGAVVGFLLSILLLSGRDPAPPVAAPENAPRILEAPALIRQHLDLKSPPGAARHGAPMLLQQLEAAASDAGHDGTFR